jgi:hypothetical protein
MARRPLLPDLPPAHDAAIGSAPRRGRFKPASAVFWDAGRGVAIGGTHPCLLGRTSDGGKTWQVVDASAVPLVRLTRTGAGAAIARFAGSARIAATADYGRSWSPQFGWPLIQVARG